MSSEYLSNVWDLKLPATQKLAMLWLANNTGDGEVYINDLDNLATFSSSKNITKTLIALDKKGLIAVDLDTRETWWGKPVEAIVTFKGAICA